MSPHMLDKQEFLDFFTEGLGMYLDSAFKVDEKYHLEDYFMHLEGFLKASEAILAAWSVSQVLKDNNA